MKPPPPGRAGQAVVLCHTIGAGSGHSSQVLLVTPLPPLPHSSPPTPLPPHLLEVRQSAGGGRAERLDAVRPAGQASNTGRKKLALGFLGAAGMRCCYTARTSAPPLPRRPRFWPRKPAKAGPPALFSTRSHMRPKRARVLDGRAGGAIAAPGPPEKSRFRSVGAAIGRSTHCQHRTEGGGACGPRPEGRSWERRNRTREIPTLDCPARYLRMG